MRDSALVASGLLSDKVGGPSVFPPQPSGVDQFTQVRRPWVASEGPDRYRRGLYTHFWRAAPYPGLTVFDAPDAGQVCPSRPRSTTPLQALNLFNSSFLLEQAAELAAKAQTIPLAYQLVYQRQPSKDELTDAETFVKQEGLPAFCRALLNSNEFLFLE